MLNKKAATAAIVGALAIGALAPASAFADYLGYSDLDESHWAVSCGTVAWATDNHAVNGYPDGTWRPDQVITRGEVAAVLWNAMGNPAAGAGAAQFADVSEDDWYADAALWAKSEGVFSGDAGTSNFRGADPITREQAAKVLCLWSDSAEHDGSSVDGFADAGSVAGWARGVVSWAVDEGVISGRETDSGRMVAGGGTATRAEFLTMLSKVKDGVMEDTDLTGKAYVVDAAWVPEYQEVEVPVYEQKWVADTYTGPCSHTYCCGCGYDADGKAYIPKYIVDELIWKPGGFVGTVWKKYSDMVFDHVANNVCGANDKGQIYVDWGTGTEVVDHTVELETGHYEQVQTGTKTELQEVGGHWELTGGHWE